MVIYKLNKKILEKEKGFNVWFSIRLITYYKTNTMPLFQNVENFGFWQVKNTKEAMF